MRRLVLVFLVLFFSTGALLADVVTDCQPRDLWLSLRACSLTIFESSYVSNARPNDGANAGSPMRAAAPITKVVDVGDAAQGLAYAQKTCAGCHNVLGTGAAVSPNKDAPPFKHIANTPGMSITALTVWSRTSHPTMPNFVIPPNDMDNLIAYIMSLRDR
jgi:mono/diheme cytochrome c family protein